MLFKADLLNVPTKLRTYVACYSRAGIILKLFSTLINQAPGMKKQFEPNMCVLRTLIMDQPEWTCCCITLRYMYSKCLLELYF